VTDDTAACELIGQAVRLVCHTEPNPKVTRPEDVPWVEMLLMNRKADGVRALSSGEQDAARD
jgi:2-C-methyl-D-erythritol 4-phosphate cytidylyltransferase